MIQGSCLCRQVTYELRNAPIAMNLCHCTMCRKATGSAYGVFAHIDATQFRWRSGAEQVTKYESSPGEFRAFCSQCGSNLPVCDDANSSVCIPAGGLDDDPGIEPGLQIFAASKAPWHKLAADPPAFDEFEPDDSFD